MNRLSLLMVLLFFSFLSGCAGTDVKEASDSLSRGATFTITDISKGLPVAGLWRQDVALIDMDGDGLLDIIAPPPRLAKAEQKRPFIFTWDKEKGRWAEGRYAFPAVKDYNYGGIAAGDVNKDGYIDILLGAHAERIILLLNDKAGSFVDSALPIQEFFRSRSVSLADINDDGWLDIIALSETPEMQDKKPERPGKKGEGIQRGILIGINKDGKEWDVRIIRIDERFFGDSFTIADINGDGKKDIIIAPATTIKSLKKIIWLGDGKGNFTNYEADFLGDMIPYRVRKGDIDGDGRDEIIFKLSAREKDAQTVIRAFKWTGTDVKGISPDVPLKATPIVFDLKDMDNDLRDELIVLLSDGLHIYKYRDKEWVEVGYHRIPPADTEGAYDLKIERQRDGSWVVVYNLGSENTATNKGIRAYVLK